MLYIRNIAGQIAKPFGRYNMKTILKSCIIYLDPLRKTKLFFSYKKYGKHCQTPSASRNHHLPLSTEISLKVVSCNNDDLFTTAKDEAAVVQKSRSINNSLPKIVEPLNILSWDCIINEGIP